MGNIRVLIFIITLRPFRTLNISFIICRIVYSIASFSALSAIKKSGAEFSMNPRIVEILMVVGFGFATFHFALKYQCGAKSKFGVEKGSNQAHR